MVGSATGGGYDQYARVFARHIGKHIPGNPSTVVQNMPGAGSVTALRYLDANAPKDGSVVLSFNSSLITASSAVSSVSNSPPLASKQELYRIVSSVPRNRLSASSSSRWICCVPQMNRTDDSP